MDENAELEVAYDEITVVDGKAGNKTLTGTDGTVYLCTPHVMRKVGEDIDLVIDGVEQEARVNYARKITYVTLDGVGYRTMKVLDDGASFVSADWEPKAKAPKAPKLDADGNPVARKPRTPKAPKDEAVAGEGAVKAKRTRKPKVEAVAE
jgi:hypothetical protein